jgi:hypothetical protein
VLVSLEERLEPRALNGNSHLAFRRSLTLSFKSQSTFENPGIILAISFAWVSVTSPVYRSCRANDWHIDEADPLLQT